MLRGCTPQRHSNSQGPSPGYSDIHRLVDSSGLWISDVSLLPTDSGGALDLELSLCPAHGTDANQTADGPGASSRTSRGVPPQLCSQGSLRPPRPRPSAKGEIRVVLREESSYQQEAAQIFLEHYVDYTEVRSRTPDRRQALADAAQCREVEATPGHGRCDSYEFGEAPNRVDEGSDRRCWESAGGFGSYDAESDVQQQQQQLHGRAGPEGFGSFEAVEPRDDFCFPQREPSLDPTRPSAAPATLPNASCFDLPEGMLQRRHPRSKQRELRKVLSSRRYQEEESGSGRVEEDVLVRRTMSQERRTPRPTLLVPRTSSNSSSSQRRGPKICLSSSQDLSLQEDILLNEPGVWISDISLVPDALSSDVRLEVAVIPSPRSALSNPSWMSLSPDTTSLAARHRRNALRLGQIPDSAMHGQPPDGSGVLTPSPVRTTPSPVRTTPSPSRNRCWVEPSLRGGAQPTLYTLTDEWDILPDYEHSQMPCSPLPNRRLPDESSRSFLRSKSCLGRTGLQRPRPARIPRDSEEAPPLYSSKTMPKRQGTPGSSPNHTDGTGDVLMRGVYHHSPISSTLSPASTESSFWNREGTPSTALSSGASEMSMASAFPSPYWCSSIAPSSLSGHSELRADLGSGRSTWQMQSPQWSSVAEAGNMEELSLGGVGADDAEGSLYPSPYWNESALGKSKLGGTSKEVATCEAPQQITCLHDEVQFQSPRERAWAGSTGEVQQTARRPSAGPDQRQARRLFVAKKLGGSFSMPGESDVRLSFASLRGDSGVLQPRGGVGEGEQGGGVHERQMTVDFGERKVEVRSRMRRATRKLVKDASLMDDMYAVFGEVQGRN